MHIKRFPNNPILGPDRDHDWEAQAVFNGCPVKDDDGSYHLLYRAQSYERIHNGIRMEVSTIGHTKSEGSKAFNGERKQFIFPEKDWEAFGCEDPRVTKIDDMYYIIYTALSDYPHSPGGIKLGVAITKDFKTIEAKHQVTHFNSKAMALFPEKIDGKYWAVLTMNTDLPPVRIAVAAFDRIEQMWDKSFWDEWLENLDAHTVHLQRALNDHIEIGAPPVKTEAGWLLLYSYIRGYRTGHPIFGIDAALLKTDNPRRVVGRTSQPLITPQETYELHGMFPNIVFPSGALLEDDTLRLYYGAADCTVATVDFSCEELLERIRHRKCEDFVGDDANPVQLERFEGNPIIEPNSAHKWEEKYTLNPTAIRIEEKTYILYRAQDNDDTSYVALAIAPDGFHVEEKFDEPIYVPRVYEEVREEPGFSGCEDARITRMTVDGEDKLFMCYTAYNGHDHARVAFTSISAEDFRAHNWQAWTLPQIISQPDEFDKNSCLVEEKIDGKYMFFHRLRNDIWIDTVDSLEFDKDSDGNVSNYLRGKILMSPRKDTWDSVRIGIAGPPIKIATGEWVLIYHAISESDGMYRLGAALLDLEKGEVVSRLPYPILTPEADYEHEGLRPGTVFSCGQVIIDDTLYVYYGGADQVTCAASMDFSCLVDALQENKD